jgi:dipeptidase E
MHKTIVAIGGGVIRTRGTVAIDREIMRLSGKRQPKLLFVPTASSDSQRYCERINNYFGRFLKCKTDVLFLMGKRPTKQHIREKILSADIIYVGGGNTLQMMRIWRRLGVDKVLRSVRKRNRALWHQCRGNLLVRLRAF